VTASEFTHLDPLGRARMVDVTAKDATHRRAIARWQVTMSIRPSAIPVRGGVPSRIRSRKSGRAEILGAA